MSALDAAAATFEGRLSRAMARAFDRMRERISISDLAAVIAKAQIRHQGGYALGPQIDQAVTGIMTGTDALLEPAQAIIRDAVMRGGRAGAAEINEVLKGEV